MYLQSPLVSTRTRTTKLETCAIFERKDHLQKKGLKQVPDGKGGRVVVKGHVWNGPHARDGAAQVPAESSGAVALHLDLHIRRAHGAEGLVDVSSSRLGPAHSIHIDTVATGDAGLVEHVECEAARSLCQVDSPGTDAIESNTDTSGKKKHKKDGRRNQEVIYKLQLLYVDNQN